MSSYLNIYLERKPKEGEESGERLLLCSISRVSPIYSLFYDNDIGFYQEDGYHEFTHGDFNEVIDDLTDDCSKFLLDIAHLKENLPLVSEKESITDILDQINSSKNYVQELMHRRSNLMALGTLFADVGEEWSDFSKLYWKID